MPPALRHAVGTAYFCQTTYLSLQTVIPLVCSCTVSMGLHWAQGGIQLWSFIHSFPLRSTWGGAGVQLMFRGLYRGISGERVVVVLLDVSFEIFL